MQVKKLGYILFFWDHCHNLHFACGCDALADGKSGGQ